jgi:hypothetical protein
LGLEPSLALLDRGEEEEGAESIVLDDSSAEWPFPISTTVTLTGWSRLPCFFFEILKSDLRDSIQREGGMMQAVVVVEE